MKTSKIFIKCLLLSMSLLVGCQSVKGQAHNDTVKDKDGNTYTVKIMPDNSQWLTKNLNINVEESWCYQDNPGNCNTYGRLYTLQSAVKACSLLGEGWHLPTNAEWESMASHFGGVRDKSDDGGKAAFKAMLTGGTSGFNVVLGGNREIDGKSYARLNAHGFYWTSTENADGTVWFYNLGAGGQILNRHEDGDKREAVSVRCVRNVQR